MPPNPAFVILGSLVRLWPFLVLLVLVAIVGAIAKARTRPARKARRRGGTPRGPTASTQTRRPLRQATEFSWEGDVDRAKEKGRLGEAKVARRLDVHAIPHVGDVYVKSGRGYAQVDHVAHMGDHLLVIETKNFDGMVLADPRWDQWAHYVGGGPKHSFQNTLRQNAKHTEVVSAAINETVEVKSLVVFVGEASFPQGIPNGVIRIGKFDAYVAGNRRPRTAAADAAWDVLLHVIASVDREEASRLHMNGVKAGRASRARRYFPRG